MPKILLKQEKIDKHICKRLFSTMPQVVSAFVFYRLFFHRYSIVTPSHLHRLSIETMEYRWITDGQSMDYLMIKMGLAREVHRSHNGFTSIENFPENLGGIGKFVYFCIWKNN